MTRSEQSLGVLSIERALTAPNIAYLKWTQPPNPSGGLIERTSETISLARFSGLSIVKASQERHSGTIERIQSNTLFVISAAGASLVRSTVAVGS